MNNLQIEKKLMTAIEDTLTEGAARSIRRSLQVVFVRIKQKATEPAWDSVMDSVNAALNIWLTNNTPATREQAAVRARHFLTTVDDINQIKYWIADIRKHVLPVIQEFHDYPRR